MERKVAIVTAASSGIGAACARELATAGYAVSLLARSSSVSRLAEELGGMATLGSMTEISDLQRLVDATLDRYGRVDALVNNAGHPAKGDLLELSDEDWRNGMDMILLSVIRMARMVTPVIEKQGGGSIVNITSFAAQEPSLPRPVSSVFRAAVSSYTKLYSDRYASKNIRMNSVLPGWVDTYPVAESDLAQIPMGRPAHASEIARTVVFLLSDNASYITGEMLRVDGGMMRGL